MKKHIGWVYGLKIMHKDHLDFLETCKWEWLYNGRWTDNSPLYLAEQIIVKYKNE